MTSAELKDHVQNGLPTIGYLLRLPSPDVAEVMAASGADWLIIDADHGSANWETVEEMIRAIEPAGLIPLVRVQANDPYSIRKALDRGARGVMVPFVNTAEAARHTVAASMYPPEGVRPISLNRTTWQASRFVDSVAEWNRQVVVICLIETPEAIANIDEIARVPGVDVLFIGKNDLSASLGHFREFSHSDFMNAVARVHGAAKAARKAVGFMTAGAEEALQCIDKGYRFVAIGSDARALYKSVASTCEKVRTGVRERALV